MPARTYGGAFKQNALDNEHRFTTYTNINDELYPNKPFYLWSHPDYFLAYESDNVGLFDESNNDYYITAKNKRGAKVRVFKPKMSLVVTDENDNKSALTVSVISKFKEEDGPPGMLIVKRVSTGGTRRGKRYTRRR